MSFILKRNKGFTLIEVIIAVTISMGVVLLVSYSLKFFIHSWDKSKKVFLINQKYLFINSLISEELNFILPLKYNGKIFFKGDADYLVFISQNSGTVYSGLNEIGYFFEKDKSVLFICFHPINKVEDIIDYEILKEEGNCIDFDNINSLTFTYKTSDEIEKEIDGNIPFKINIDIAFKIDENNVEEKQINIAYYE